MSALSPASSNFVSSAQSEPNRKISLWQTKEGKSALFVIGMVAMMALSITMMAVSKNTDTLFGIGMLGGVISAFALLNEGFQNPYSSY